MELTIHTVDDVAVVVVPGDGLDASNADDFQRDLEPVLARHPRVVLDLSELRYVDSTGLGSILTCRRRLATHGGDLKLCGTSYQVRKLFELVRLHRVVDVHRTREEAVQAFS